MQPDDDVAESKQGEIKALTTLSVDKSPVALYVLLLSKLFFYPLLGRSRFRSMC